MADRRVFLQVLTAAVAASACGGGDGPTSPGPSSVRVPLPPVGGTVVNTVGGPGNQGVAVTRLAVDSVVAVSRRCTHQGCTVGAPPSPGANMTCPCHGSVYTLQGTVVSGPAPASLATFPAVIDAAAAEVVVSFT